MPHNLSGLTKCLLSLVFVTGLGFSAVAEEHGHEDENFPEGALLILEGQDAITKQECFLFVMDSGFTGAEQTPDQFYADVLTSYSHGAEKADLIRIQPKAAQNQLLIGTGSNGKDQLGLFLPTQDLDLTTATAFNAKWWHTNHYHNNRCANLKVHAH